MRGRVRRYCGRDLALDTSISRRLLSIARRRELHALWPEVGEDAGCELYLLSSRSSLLAPRPSRLSLSVALALASSLLSGRRANRNIEEGLVAAPHRQNSGIARGTERGNKHNDRSERNARLNNEEAEARAGEIAKKEERILRGGDAPLLTAHSQLSNTAAQTSLPPSQYPTPPVLSAFARPIA